MNIPNQFQNDHPYPIDNARTDHVKFSMIRDNIEILWKRVNDIRRGNTGGAIQGGAASSGSASTSTPVTPVTPTTDEFRFFASLVNFKYDYQEFTWDSANNIVQVNYRLGGSTGSVVGTLTITWDADGNPSSVSMTGSNTGSGTFSYDTLGYLESYARS